MADAVTKTVGCVTNRESSVTTGNTETEDIQNQQNENSENKSVENGGVEELDMDVDGGEAPESGIKVEAQESGGGKDCGQNILSAITASVKESESGSSDIQAKIENQGEATPEDSKIKTEADKDGGDGDAYMVLEEADGDDNESNMSEEDELTENEQLRRANFQLSERLALLEEFIQVEFSDKFEKFKSKRERLVDVVGLGQKYDGGAKVTGKRSAKSVELIGLLKIVNDQARTNRRGSWRNNNKNSSNPANGSESNISRFTPKQQTGKDVEVKKEETSTASASTKTEAASQIRCHRCKATGHVVRKCPMPIDPRDRRIILRRKDNRETRKDKKQRNREEGEKYPQIKALRDKRRRIGRVLNRERQKVINPWATGL